MKFRPLTVVVVGLLPGQAKQLEAACKRFARVRCVDSKQGKTRLPWGDFVVLVAKFIGHAAQWRAYRQFPRDRVWRHHGGLKGVAGLVESLVGAQA